MAVCDICGAPGMGTIIGAEDMRKQELTFTSTRDGVWNERANSKVVTM